CCRRTTARWACPFAPSTRNDSLRRWILTSNAAAIVRRCSSRLPARLARRVLSGGMKAWRRITWVGAVGVATIVPQGRRRRAVIIAPHDRPPHRNPRRQDAAAGARRRRRRWLRGRRADVELLQPAGARRARHAAHPFRRARGRADPVRI